MTEVIFTSSVYLDSNIFIYYLDEESAFCERAKNVMATALQAGKRLVTSEITIAECIYKPSRDGDFESVELFKTAFESDLFEILALTGALAIRAAEQVAQFRLKLIDCIHYMTALEAGCDQFVTADRKFKSSQYLDVVII